MRLSRLLRHGALAGAAAGIASALVMWLHTEPVMRRALAIESARAAADHTHESELVSRTAQVVVGAVTAALVGVLVGLVFAVVFARTRQRLPGQSDHTRALWLAVLGFCAFVVMPTLVIPANPPAVGAAGTVTQRTLTYVLAVLVGVLLVGAVSGLDRLLSRRPTDPPVRLSLDLLATVALVALAVWLLPGNPDPIPSDVPAALVWDFRLASVTQLATMWLVLATVFGLLVTRSSGAARVQEPATR